MKVKQLILYDFNIIISKFWGIKKETKVMLVQVRSGRWYFFI